MTLLEALQSLAGKLNIDYSDIANNSLFSATDLKDYIATGCQRAWDFKRWDFTEGSKTQTLSAQEVSDGYIDYPTDFAARSIHLFKIGGKEYKKIKYQDFLKYLEDYSTGTKRIAAEYKRFIFFNTNVATAGQIIDIYGKLKFQAITADADLLPFSDADQDNQENSGNAAVVLLAYSEALASQKKKDPAAARVQEQKALSILSALWGEIEEDGALEQNMRPAFNVPDFFSKGNPTDGSDNRGTFNI